MYQLEVLTLVASAIIVLVSSHEASRYGTAPPNMPSPHAHGAPPAPHGHNPQGHGHAQQGHGSGHQPRMNQQNVDNRLRDRSHTHNEEHIKEHLDGVVNMKQDKPLSEEELQFHYFKLHDYDNNDRLDGIELTTAVTHFHKDEDPNNVPRLSESEIENIIDTILHDEDINRDGYIDYTEFMVSQKNAQVQAQAQAQAQAGP